MQGAANKGYLGPQQKILSSWHAKRGGVWIIDAAVRQLVSYFVFDSFLTLYLTGFFEQVFGCRFLPWSGRELVVGAG
jgi:hypothetical protein